MWRARREVDMLEDLAEGVEALRLNRHFPSSRTVAAWLRALALEETELDPEMGWPRGSHWLALDVARRAAGAQADGLGQVASGALPPASRAHLEARLARLARLQQLPALPRNEVTVQLRHRDGARASYQVVVDRFDVSTATLARYTMILADTPGRRVSSGELEIVAAETFRSALELLSSEDAALAFVLLSQHVLEVEEVVRGVMGPMLIPGRAGPAALAQVSDVPVASACLERASIHLRHGVVDDPLVASVVVPRADTAFGVSRRRKWATGAPEPLRSWLAGQGSRNLVYTVEGT